MFHLLNSSGLWRPRVTLWKRISSCCFLTCPSVLTAISSCSERRRLPLPPGRMVRPGPEGSDWPLAAVQAPQPSAQLQRADEARLSPSEVPRWTSYPCTPEHAEMSLTRMRSRGKALPAGDRRWRTRGIGPRGGPGEATEACLRPAHHHSYRPSPVPFVGARPCRHLRLRRLVFGTVSRCESVV